MRSPSLFCALLSLVMLPVLGCGGEKLDKPAEPGASGTTANVASEEESSPGFVPASAEEAEEFGRQLEKAFAENDQRQLGLLIDWDAMAAIALEGLGDEKMRKQLHEGLVASTYGPNNLFNAMRAAGGPDMSYKLLRVKPGKKRQHVWFRMNSDAGVNYHDFEVVKQGERLKAIDVYFMMSGERLSQTWRRGLLPVINEHSKNWLQKMTSAESEYVRAFPKIERMQQQINAGDAAGALQTYHSLPESVRLDKSLLLMRYRVANDLMDDNEIIATAADVKKAYPGDACLDLLLVDSLYMRKEFEEALASVDRVEKVIGGDPHLDFLRGSLHLEAGNLDGARESFERAIAGDPEAWEFYSGLVQVSLRTGDHQLTYDTLRKLQTFDLIELTLDDLPGYPEFMASPQGQQWLAETGE